MKIIPSLRLVFARGKYLWLPLREVEWPKPDYSHVPSVLPKCCISISVVREMVLGHGNKKNSSKFFLKHSFYRPNIVMDTHTHIYWHTHTITHLSNQQSNWRPNISTISAVTYQNNMSKISFKIHLVTK